MKKRWLILGLHGVLAAAFVVGCTKKSGTETTEAFQTAMETRVESAAEETNETSHEEFMNQMASMAETTAVDYSIAAVTNEAGETEYKFVPTKFPVYKDGESHRVMIGATEKDYFYGQFTNTAYPDNGVKAISLPTSMVSPEKGKKIIDKGDMTSFLDFEDNVLYDTSARYATDKIPVYSIENPYYVFRAWTVDYDGDPEKLTPEEMLGFYIDDASGVDKFFWEQDRLDGGAYRYSINGFFPDYPRKASYSAFGRYVTILKDGKAYCYVFGAYDTETAYLFSTYALYHSFEFEE